MSRDQTTSRPAAPLPLPARTLREAEACLRELETGAAALAEQNSALRSGVAGFRAAAEEHASFLAAARVTLGRLERELAGARAERRRRALFSTPVPPPGGARDRPASPSLARRVAVNLVTALVTSAVLAAIAAASYSHDRRPARADVSPRLVGVTTDPWHVDEWNRALGAEINVVANFMAWDYRKSPRARLAESGRRGVATLITWEPWKPTKGRESGAAQPRYTNSAIARGALDGYIRRFARDCATAKTLVLIRLAHEMNASWYPWHRDPRAYVEAWRRIHRIFREEGAKKVRFVWSPNPPLGGYDFRKWQRDVRAYWPGAAYVDWVGTTMIGRNGKTVEHFAPRVALLRGFGKPVLIPEAYAVRALRPRWLPSLRSWLAANPWIRGIVWSEGARVHSLYDDPRPRRVFGHIARELLVR